MIKGFKVYMDDEQLSKIRKAANLDMRSISSYILTVALAAAEEDLKWKAKHG